MKKKRVILGLAAGFLAAATAIEVTGYSWFDREDGSNILCDIDPTCRYLTDAEKDLARSVFGDRINYNSIKVFNRNWFFVSLTDDFSAVTPNGNIYLKNPAVRVPDLTGNASNTQLFVHELTHVWQHQTGNDVIMNAYRAWRHAGRQYSRAYDVEIIEGKPFSEYQIEQQAEIVETYFAQRQRLRTYLQENHSIVEALQDSSQTSHLPRSKRTRFFNGLSNICTTLLKWEQPVRDNFPVFRDTPCHNPNWRISVNFQPLDRTA